MKKCYNCNHYKEIPHSLNCFGAVVKYSTFECFEIVSKDTPFWDDGDKIQCNSNSIRVGMNFSCNNWIEKEAEYVGFSESESEEAQQKVS